jgi:hypothetical protein
MLGCSYLKLLTRAEAAEMLLVNRYIGFVELFYRELARPNDGLRKHRCSVHGAVFRLA